MTLHQLLLDVMVRPDWRTRTLQATASRLHLWRGAELAVATVTLTAVVAGLLLPQSWGLAQRAVLYAALFWLAPPIIVSSARRDSLRVSLGVVGVGLPLLLAVVVALVAVPRLLPDAAVPLALALVTLLAVAAWPLAFRMSRRYPMAARQMGLTWDGWLPKILAGAAAGLAIGLHLLITGQPLLGLSSLPELPTGPLLFTLLAVSGLVALGQELFFRGWCYDLLFHDSPAEQAGATAKIVILNLLAYAGYITLMPSAGALIWFLIYGALLALSTTVLRRRMHSVLPALACNAVASLFLAYLMIGL